MGNRISDQRFQFVKEKLNIDDIKPFKFPDGLYVPKEFFFEALSKTPEIFTTFTDDESYTSYYLELEPARYIRVYYTIPSTLIKKMNEIAELHPDLVDMCEDICTYDHKQLIKNIFDIEGYNSQGAAIFVTDTNTKHPCKAGAYINNTILQKIIRDTPKLLKKFIDENGHENYYIDESNNAYDNDRGIYTKIYTEEPIYSEEIEKQLNESRKQHEQVVSQFLNSYGLIYICKDE